MYKLKRYSIFKSFLFILIAGMGNVKQGNWQCILIYFSSMILLGIGLFYTEQKIIEPYFHPSQTLQIFLILVYVAFVFFWNGSNLFSLEERNPFFYNQISFSGSRESYTEQDYLQDQRAPHKHKRKV